MQERFITPREQAGDFGFALWHARPRPMPVSHQHNDVEVNLVLSGTITYLFAGQLRSLQQGQVAVFWAARPHQVVDVADDTWFRGVSVPLSWFHACRLPGTMTQKILGGGLILSDGDAAPGALETQHEAWLDDLDQDSLPRRRVMLLELEAWFHRFALAKRYDADGDPAPGPPQKGLEHVTEIAAFITQHYADPISVGDVAEAVGLHPNYAVQVFKKRTGATIVDFIMKQRLAHAQQLLASTDDQILDIALASGFGSASRFYAVFRDALKMTPREYRAMLRKPRRDNL